MRAPVSMRLISATAGLPVIEVKKMPDSHSSQCPPGQMLYRAITFAILAAVSCQSPAQDYPAKAMRFIVPYPPGGASDVVARLIGQHMSDTWRQPAFISLVSLSGLRVCAFAQTQKTHKLTRHGLSATALTPIRHLCQLPAAAPSQIKRTGFLTPSPLSTSVPGSPSADPGRYPRTSLSPRPCAA